MKRTWEHWLYTHYHWVVAAVVFLEFSTAIGLANNIYSIYLIPVTQGLGVSRGVFSIAPSIKYLAAFFSNLAFGLLYRHWGYRQTTTVALVLTAVAYVGYATARSMAPFYLGAVLVGLSEAFCSTAGTARVISSWFHRHQGLVLGVVMASSGLGGSLFSVVMTAVMARWSWRTALGISASLLLLAAVLVCLLVRDAPAWMGLQPLGDEEDRQRAKEKQTRKPAGWDGIPIAVLKRRGYFYVILAATFLVGIVNYSIFPIIAAHLQDRGLSAAGAASVQGVMFLAMAGAKIVEGLCCDRFGARSVMIFCLLCSAGGAVLLTWGGSIGIAVAAVVLFSFGLATTTVMLPTLTAELFGERDYGSVLGMELAAISLSGVVALPAMNFSFDLLGSYVPGLWCLSLVSLVTLLLYLTAFRGARRERRRMESV